MPMLAGGQGQALTRAVASLVLFAVLVPGLGVSDCPAA